MREILFRGKRADNGEWIEGDLLQYLGWGKVHIAQHYLGAGGQEVIPETVGQYTGLTDKNGTKIFEGDIVSEKPSMNNTAYVGHVAYDEKDALWRFMILNSDHYNGVVLGSYSTSYAVIGNIYDNSELLRSDR